MSIRYERKYLVPVNQMAALRKRITPFVRPDIFAVDQGGYAQYTVRSIYLDNHKMDAYYEKVEGLKNRKKLRIRGYDTQKEDSIVFLEIKRKLENRIDKDRAKLYFRDLQAFLRTGDFDKYLIDPKEEAREDARHFLFYYNAKQQKPADLIVYEREPFHGRFDPGVRITFDKNIRGSIKPPMDELFREAGLKLLWPKHFILEIKYFTDHMPSWARSIVDEFHLSHQALSKYAQGIDVCTPPFFRTFNPF